MKIDYSNVKTLMPPLVRKKKRPFFGKKGGFVLLFMLK